MHVCLQGNATFVLAGSIRDDGPLPDSAADTLEAQRLMRAEVRQGVDLVLVLSSMLHGIATGNFLSAAVTTVCAAIPPAAAASKPSAGSWTSKAFSESCAANSTRLLRRRRSTAAHPQKHRFSMPHSLGWASPYVPSSEEECPVFGGCR